MLSRRLVLMSGVCLLGGVDKALPTELPPKTPPDPAPTPPPASVSAPVVGTDLTAVWNLQFSGTGPRSPPTNGKWSGAIDAYATSKGVIRGNDGALFWNLGAANGSLDRYDFAGAPNLHATSNGNGETAVTAAITDCAFGPNGLQTPVDINGGYNLSSGAIAVNVRHCLFDEGGFYHGSGSLAFSYCRFKNQKQGLGDSGYNSPGAAHLSYDWCYITGGGIRPAPGAHVELTQIKRAVGSFTVSNCLVDISKDGQISTLPWGSGWTGFFTLGLLPAKFENCIFIGARAVDANRANRNVVACIIEYQDLADVTITNCVFEPGIFGYTHNGNGTATRPKDGGGNRSFDNKRITAKDFG
jgi:hypothetical protein